LKSRKRRSIQKQLGKGFYVGLGLLHEKLKGAIIDDEISD